MILVLELFSESKWLKFKKLAYRFALFDSILIRQQYQNYNTFSLLEKVGHSLIIPERCGINDKNSKICLSFFIVVITNIGMGHDYFLIE